MVYIHTKSRTSKISDFHTSSNDTLHDRRKSLESDMKDGLLSRDQMNMLDCKDENQENARVEQYDRWKDTSVKGVSNQDRMTEWGNLNREMKRRGEEGNVHTIDQIRDNKKIQYD